jgi:hypothetical protein
MDKFVMTKTRERNSNYLTSLGRRTKGQATPKVGQIITLYNQGKISQLQTAENIIIKLTRAKNEKELKSAFKQYDKLVGKSETKEPLSKRLVEKKQVKTKAAKTIVKAFKKHLEPKIEFRNLDKAQNQILFHLDHIRGYDKLNLTQLYPKLKTRIYNEARKLLVIKNNIKLTMGCNATFIKNKKDDNKEREFEEVSSQVINEDTEEKDSLLV